MFKTEYSNLHRSLFKKKLLGMRINGGMVANSNSNSNQNSQAPPPPQPMEDFFGSPNDIPPNDMRMSPMFGDSGFPPEITTSPTPVTSSDDFGAPSFPPFLPPGNNGMECLFPSPPAGMNPPPFPSYITKEDMMVDEEEDAFPNPPSGHPPRPMPPFHPNSFSNVPQEQMVASPPCMPSDEEGGNFLTRTSSFVTTKGERDNFTFGHSVNKFSMFRRSSSSNLLLPTLRPSESKNPQCNTINGKTLAKFFRKKRKHDIILVDCRFPYEFQNGTIAGSVNIYQEHVLRAFFFTKKKPETIVVFYCEYSSKRGPKMYESMRKFDREENIEKYPYLDYSQIYLLEGGYRKFFKNSRKRGYGLCVPDCYCRMDDQRFNIQFQKNWKEWKDSFKMSMAGRNCGVGMGGKRRRRSITNRLGVPNSQVHRCNSFNFKYLNRT